MSPARTFHRDGEPGERLTKRRYRTVGGLVNCCVFPFETNKVYELITRAAKHGPQAQLFRTGLSVFDFVTPNT